MIFCNLNKFCFVKIIIIKKILKLTDILGDLLTLSQGSVSILSVIINICFKIFSASTCFLHNMNLIFQTVFFKH